MFFAISRVFLDSAKCQKQNMHFYFCVPHFVKSCKKKWAKSVFIFSVEVSKLFRIML